MLFFFLRGHVSGPLHSLDPRSCTFRMNCISTVPPDVEPITTFGAYLFIAECGLLVVYYTGTKRNAEQDVAGDDMDASEIRVFDLGNYSNTHVFRGEQDAGCSSFQLHPQMGSQKALFYRRNQPDPEILDLNDGTLLRGHPFSHFGERQQHYLNIIPVSPRYFVYVDKYFTGTPIYHSETGRLVRVLDHPHVAKAPQSVVSESRQEVFLGLDKGPTIAAYCLSEP